MSSMKLKKKWFRINGANRMVVYDPDTDTIADVVRRLGLTGTKIGCGTGQCGACSMIINGELVRGCVKKAERIPEHAEIITIEGIGTPNNLHPIQQAWITYGGVQCGFCSPGFIVSAYALLQKEPSPTRTQVRDWFTKNHNICRCTGYKPLVDAVMAAAAVLRGEKTMEDITFKMEGESIYNTRYPKPTALEKVTGLCDYGDDLALKMPEGTLHLAIVQTKAHHARILSVNTEKAKGYPGVVAVFTAKDVDGPNKCDAGAPAYGHFSKPFSGFTRPIINGDKIYRYGDVVAVVAAVNERAARAAAKLVEVELEELPAYQSVLESLQPGALQIHENGPCNLFDGQRISKGPDVRDVFANAPHVVEGSFYSSRQPHLVIEPDVLQAYIDQEGRLTIHSKAQALYVMRSLVAKGLDLPLEKVRLIQNPTGGSFGYSMSPTPLCIVGLCALKLQVPVTMTLNYAEHQLLSGKRAACFTNGRMACDNEGNLLAYEFDAMFDVGAYNEKATKLVYKACHFYGYPYSIPSIQGLSRSGFSNNANAITYRGFGMPQVYTSGEALIDMMAEKIGMDPFEFRYKNAIKPGDTIATNVCLDEYPIQEMMDMIRSYYEEAKQRAKTLSNDTIKRGVGVACGGYSSAGPNDKAEVALELNEDGTVTVYNTWGQMGQGADIGTLVHVHEALRPLGIRPEQIRLDLNDTAYCPDTGPAAGSRSHYMAGLAIIDAANKMMDAMRKPDGTYRTYQEMVDEGLPTKFLGKHVVPSHKTHLVDPLQGVGRNVPEFNYIVMVAEVEVNVKTGKVKCVAAKGVANVGVVGNYLAVEGQAYGGFQHCIGFALTEDYSTFDEKYKSMVGCGAPTCNDVPDELEFDFHITPRPDGPHGSIGCSENFQSCGHMAIINAINNAVGVRIYELPATPAKILAALKAKEEGRELKPAKYDFGDDFYEVYDRVTAKAKEISGDKK